jgi:DNA-binding transcriptional regulator YiaG
MVDLAHVLFARRALPPPDGRRQLREAAGVSLAAVGRAVGVSGECVRLWEAGLRFPSGERLGRYVEVLQLLEAHDEPRHLAERRP